MAPPSPTAARDAQAPAHYKHLIVCPASVPLSARLKGKGQAVTRSREGAEKEAKAIGCALFNSIGAALLAASDGDIVTVFPGVYNETLNLTKSVTVRVHGGLEGDHVGDVTVANAGSTVVVSSAFGVRLQGLRLVHTEGASGGRGRDGPRCLEVCSGNLTCESCWVSSEVGSAVMAADGGSIVMRGCRLGSSGRCGLICVSGGKAECSSCDLSDNALNGADVQSGGYVILRGNRVCNNQQTGVLVADQDSFVHIEGNDITDNARRGVTAQRSGSFVLTANRILRNQNIGVIGIGPWEEQTPPLRMVGNIISENKGAGLWVQKGNADVFDNVICSNGDSGIVAFGCKKALIIRGNHLYGNMGVGVSIHTTMHATLLTNMIGFKRKKLPPTLKETFMMCQHERLGGKSGCKMFDDVVCNEILKQCDFDDPRPNKGVGIEIQGSRAMIKDNVVANCGDVGLLVCEKSRIELEGNKIHSSGFAGMQVCGAETACTSSGNEFVGNRIAGVEVTQGGTWISLRDDKVAKSEGWGVWLHDGASNVHMQGLLLDANQSGGLSVEASCQGTRLLSCVLSRNKVTALKLSAPVVTHQNTFTCGPDLQGRKVVTLLDDGCTREVSMPPPVPALPMPLDF